MNGAQALIESLLREGVTHMFGYAGATICPAVDALKEHPEIEYTLVRTEQNAGHMASGYARISGKVGVNVPNATVMMIENAERFGLAQLHQLRGRVGRGDAQSFCIMVNCSHDENTGERLDILNRSNDGFYIASEDLKLRGPGDIFGLRQSGDMEFKLADIFTDANILKRVSEEVDRLLDLDPQLELEEHRELKRKIEDYLGTNYEKLNL